MSDIGYQDVSRVVLHNIDHLAQKKALASLGEDEVLIGGEVRRDSETVRGDPLP